MKSIAKLYVYEIKYVAHDAVEALKLVDPEQKRCDEHQMNQRRFDSSAQLRHDRCYIPNAALNYGICIYTSLFCFYLKIHIATALPEIVRVYI